MNAQIIHEIAELIPFKNEQDFIEIITRDSRKRIKSIQKVMIDNPAANQQKELAEKVIHALNKNNAFNEKNINLLKNVANLEKFGLLMNGLNLCATCAGFAIMYAKLDKMSDEINRQIAQLQQDVKHIHDAQSNFEMNKVLAEHTDMLDCEKKQKPYSEEQMRKLVDDEYNVLRLLIESFQKDVSGDREATIFSIYSVLAMMTVSLRKFDEVYYFNNHNTLGDENPWHLAHEKWMSAYDIASSQWFVEKLQDYGTFDAELTTTQVDAYYKELVEQAKDLKEEVEDNQDLIIVFGDEAVLDKYKSIAAKDVADTVKAAFVEAGGDVPETTLENVYHNVMQQAAMA